MSRDFRALLADEPCWDLELHRIYSETGIPRADRVLQNREELIKYCEWIEAHGIRRYLEIGIWTGRLMMVLQRLFRFDHMAACDIGACRGYGLMMRVPFGTDLFVGDSTSDAFADWQAQRAPFDLVMVDGNHDYAYARHDVDLARRLGARHIALHDICSPEFGVRQVWEELKTEGGSWTEIVEPHKELGLASTTMGIGIWHAD